MSITSNANSTFLNVDNAHLRVSGDIHATSVKVGAIEIVPGYSLESTTGIGNTTPHTVEFTNTETSLVTSGDINMLHSSNNAAIKLNSNVVVEFPRSKKLIKYPRVALTSASQDGYVVTTSNVSVNGDSHAAYRVFDNILPDGTTTVGWRTDVGYDPATGLASGITTRFTGDSGEWVEIQLPNSLKVLSINLKPGNQTDLLTSNARFPKVFVIYGYDGNAWVRVEEFTTSPIQSFTDVQTFHISNPIGEFSKFVLVVKQTHSVTGAASGVTMIGEIEYFGVPEYDPDADGVDVKVTSYPNVPNTDWLEVYYDAKDLADGAVTSVDDLTPNGTNDGTATNVTVSDGAFVFNGNQYIQGDTGLTGNFIHSVSMWFNANNDGQLFWTGINANSGDRMNIFFSEDGGLGGNTTTPQIHYTFKGHTHYANVNPNQWYHLVCTYSGTNSSYRKIYLNGVETGADTATDGTGDTTHPLNIQDSTFYINKTNYSNGSLVGKIANFRLFNRAMTSDEVWQLYAYQKEYFGHGDLSMTLKAGRLGIGTSEPRGALDVRGDIVGSSPVYFYLGIDDDSHVAATTKIPFHIIRANKGGGYDVGTYNFTAPIGGWYWMAFGGVNRSASTVLHMSLKDGPNSTDSTILMAYDRPYGNSLMQSSRSGMVYIREGGIVSLWVTNGTVDAGNGIGSSSVEWGGFLVSRDFNGKN